MKDLSGFACFEVPFDNKGLVFDENEVKNLTKFLKEKQTSDLVVISHGWNNDIREARALYTKFFERMRAVLDSGKVPGVQQRKYAVMGVLWPSKRFADEELIPGGAAAAGSPVTETFLKKKIDDLKATFDAPGADAVLAKAKKLVSKLEDDAGAAEEFAKLVRSLAPRKGASSEDASDRFFKISPKEVIQRLSKPVPIAVPKRLAGSGGAARMGEGRAGGAAGIGEFFSGIKSGARNLLNLVTYYQMKERAGLIGRDGVNKVLRGIRADFPGLKIHLLGHSFGGRLVTAVAAGPDNQPAVKPHSLTLLQAAFSHYAFAENYEPNKHGYFRRVVSDSIVSGPILISCTQNDKAVGIAYPLASLIAGQVAAALGDKNDKFGGIGRNGAQKTPEAVDGDMRAVGGKYQFAAGKLYNLNADAFIRDHSDICRDEVAFAILTAISAT